MDFKKLVAVTGLATMLTSSAFAHGYLQFGASTNSLDSSSSSGSGFYTAIGGNVVDSTGLLLGADINMNFYTIDDVTMRNGALTLHVGYSFDKRFNIPVDISGDIGYGNVYISSASNSGWGMQYGATLEWNFGGWFGIGTKYSVQKPKINGIDFTVDSAIGYLNIRY